MNYAGDRTHTRLCVRTTIIPLDQFSDYLLWTFALTWTKLTNHRYLTGISLLLSWRFPWAFNKGRIKMHCLCVGVLSGCSGRLSSLFLPNFLTDLVARNKKVNSNIRKRESSSCARKGRQLSTSERDKGNVTKEDIK